MREDRTYGLEGGAAETTRPFLPLSRQLDLGAFQSLHACKATSWDFVPPDQDPVPVREDRVWRSSSVGFFVRVKLGENRGFLGCRNR